MNEYFKSVGFGGINSRRDLRPFILDVSQDPDESHIVQTDDEEGTANAYFEHFKNYGDCFGLMVRGNMDGESKMCIDGCYPFCVSDDDMRCSLVEVEQVDGEFIVTVCDDDSGNELAFHLQNVLDTRDGLSITGDMVNIAGLSLNGTIVLPVATDDVSEQIRREEDAHYRELSKKAHAGDKNAQTLLDEQEAEISEMIRQRLQDEDFLSVVEGFLMPVDECETGYSILGDICGVTQLNNDFTGEVVYRLALNVTGVRFELFINEDDLMGVPTEGMRFMGSCWLQGRIV